MNKFVNRENELSELHNRYNSDKFEMIVVYGRRRVGKSRLILESIENMENAVYFLAIEQDEKLNILRFKEEIAISLNDDRILSIKDDWELIFRYIPDRAKVVVIDEFPYLISANAAVKSIFQRIIDLYLVKTNITLILMGSSISMMVNEVMAYKSPLYGRRTAQIKLKQLELKFLMDFFPQYSFEEIIQTYAVLGGVPFYLNQFDGNLSIWENIEDHITNSFGLLYSEGEFLLRQEFKEISTYTTILQQIAAGRTEIKEIRDKISIKGDISSYIRNLMEIDLVERRVPLFEDGIKSRKGKYYLKDHFLIFWFRYIFPNKQKIIRGDISELIGLIQDDFTNFMGRIFENIIGELLSRAIVMNRIQLPFKPIELGRWWHRDIEFDLIGKNGSDFIIFEIKWKRLQKIDIKRIFSDLERKVKKSKFVGEFYYCIIARSGPDVVYRLNSNQLFFDLSAIEKWM